jgi:hypothetical protein
MESTLKHMCWAYPFWQIHYSSKLAQPSFPIRGREIWCYICHVLLSHSYAYLEGRILESEMHTFMTCIHNTRWYRTCRICNLDLMKYHPVTKDSKPGFACDYYALTHQSFICILHGTLKAGSYAIIWKVLTYGIFSTPNNWKTND